MSQKAVTDALASAGSGAEFIELTTADYNWNSSSGQTGTPNCVALWLLPSGIYKGPASTSIEVRATRSQDYSMGAGFPSYVIVKECENTSNNRAIVTYVDGSNGSIVEYYGIAEDGRNYSIKNFPNVVQTTGTSTTNVMSQNAVTSMVFADAGTNSKIRIGNTNNINTDSTCIGAGTVASGLYSVNLGNSSKTITKATAIGYASEATGSNSLALGFGAKAGGQNSISFPYSTTSAQGQVQFQLIGSEAAQGYNYTAYRLLSGLYDGQTAHDAVTVGQLNTRLGNLTITTISQSDYNNLQTKDPNTLYLITGA
jgi:hypothetical protein